MRRLALGVLALVFGCSGCATATILFRSTPPARDHHVRVLWVLDSVMAQLQSAAADSLESMYQVADIWTGELGQPAEPGDSAYVIVSIVPCQPALRTTTRIRAICPNPNAPTIHIHPSTGDQGIAGNNCSPSRPDYAAQLAGRHQFDAIICGKGTRPTAYWWYNNPLLGTPGFPESRTPIGPITRTSLP
jgi:hypothetical protein